MLAVWLFACTSPAPPEPAPPPPIDDTAGAPTTTGFTVDWPDVPVAEPLPDPVNPGRGRYSTPLDVRFASADDASIWLTTDGRDPRHHGVPAPDSLRVDTTTVLRLVWVDPDGDPLAPVESHTYLFADHIPAQQAPEGYPDVWWSTHPLGPFPADYAVDADVVDDPRTADVFPSVFAEVPVLSVVMDPDDLFGPLGIHENPLEEGILWEKPASIEWLDPDPSLDHGLGAGIRIQGGSSRDPAKSAKKSFRLVFKSDYGPGRWAFPAFREPGALTSFNTVVLRARYNRSWAHEDPIQRRKALFMREQLGADLQRATGWPSGHTRPVHLLLNGLYWGLYLLQERPDEHFASDTFGGSSDDWDVLNSGVVTAGERVAWDALMVDVAADLSDDPAYQRVVEQLELDAFIDYTLLNLFLGNVDWPDRNWYAARDRRGGGWRFFNWDTELIMTTSFEDRVDSIDFPGTPGHVFTRLRAHPDFRARVAARAERLFTGAGVLTPEPLQARWSELGDDVVPGVIAESARWGDHFRDDRLHPDAELYTYPDHWIPEFEEAQRVYWPVRTSNFLDQLRARDLY